MFFSTPFTVDVSLFTLLFIPHLRRSSPHLPLHFFALSVQVHLWHLSTFCLLPHSGHPNPSPIIVPSLSDVLKHVFCKKVRSCFQIRQSNICLIVVFENNCLIVVFENNFGLSWMAFHFQQFQGKAPEVAGYTTYFLLWRELSNFAKAWYFVLVLSKTWTTRKWNFFPLHSCKFVTSIKRSSDILYRAQLFLEAQEGGLLWEDGKIRGFWQRTGSFGGS